MHELSFDRLLQAGLGFRSAKTLLCALELGLFTELGRGPRTARQLYRALDLNARALPDLLDALVAMGVLDREGDDAQAVYLNTREAAHFLDRRSPANIGAVLDAANTHLYRQWDGLAAALRRGAASPDVSALADAPRPASLAAAREFDAFAARFDVSSPRTLAHAGAGGELLARALAARHPQLACAPIAPHASLPAAELIALVGVLRAHDRDGKLDWIRRAYAALPDGGCLIAIEALIDDARRRNLFALLGSLDALLERGDGFGFSGADFDGWCRDAGFRHTEVIALGATASAAVARK